MLLRHATLLGLTAVLAACQQAGPATTSSGTTPAMVGGSPTGSVRPSAYPISNAAGLEDLVSAALKHHPSLQATQARITALEQSAVQARALPDPSISGTSGQMAETAAGEAQASFGIQQKLPYPGKRGAQSDQILRKADAMRAQVGAEQLALAERVRTTYWSYYSAQKTITVVTESKGLLVTLLQSVEARVATNKASQQDLLRLENEITRLDQRLTTASGRSLAARATLNALLYRPSGSALPSPRADTPRRYGSASSLLTRAESRHPEVLAGQARIAAASHGVRLAQLKKRPDFVAGVSWTPVSDDGLAPSANGRDQIMGTIGLTMPIWGAKNRAAEKEATANLSAEQSTLAATRASLQQRIESANATYNAERANLSLYTRKLIPDAQQGFALSVIAYQADNNSFLDVIDAWRQLLSYRLEHEENRARVGKADAALRQAAGLR